MRITIDTADETRVTRSPLEAETWAEEYRWLEDNRGHTTPAVITVQADQPWQQEIGGDRGDTWADVTFTDLIDEWVREDEQPAISVPAIRIPKAA